MSEHDVNMLFQVLGGENIWNSCSDACGWCMDEGSWEVAAGVSVRKACH
jgi:hypothetical protein